MSVEAKSFPRILDIPIQPEPINYQNTTAPRCKERAAAEVAINYSERAAIVDYHSQLYLRTHELTNQYVDSLIKSGVSPRDAEEKRFFVEATLKYIAESHTDGVELVNLEQVVVDEEEKSLVKMFQATASPLQDETINQPDKYTSSNRIKAADTFLRNIFKYTNAERRQILIDLGYDEQEAQEFAINIGKAAISTIAINIIDGPVLDVLGLYLGKIGIGEDLAEQIRQGGAIAKIGATAAAAASAYAYYTTVDMKTQATLEYVRAGGRMPPNATVALTAMTYEKLYDPTEESEELRSKLRWAHWLNPLTLWDEKWNLTLLMGDYFVTYTAGNLAGTTVNTAQIAYMKTAVEFLKIQRRMQEKHDQGFILQPEDEQEISTVYMHLMTTKDAALRQYQLETPSTNEEKDRYSFNLDALSDDPLLQFKA